MIKAKKLATQGISLFTKAVETLKKSNELALAVKKENEKTIITLEKENKEATTLVENNTIAIDNLIKLIPHA